MATNMDRVFNQVYKVVPKRGALFREALSWDEFNEVPVYAADRTVQANIVDKPRYEDKERGVTVILDGVLLIVWFRDWFARATDDVTDEDLQALSKSLKGNVRETDGRNHSRFYVDGEWLQYASHACLARPDGKLYCVRITLQAA
jgi:hypothetical protein